MAQHVKVKFDPIKILDVADQLNNQQTTFSKAVGDFIKANEAVAGAWSGPAADQYASLVKALAADGESMKNLLLSHVSKLRQVSGIYKAGETKVESAVDTLPTDGVFRN